MIQALLSRLVYALLWLLHFLPLSVLARLGWGLGRLLFAVARSRRHVGATNLALCFPHKTQAERQALLREHFGWLGRSLLERGLLWHASFDRLKRLIHVEGDIGLAQQSSQSVMWLVPHFVGLELAGVAVQLFQTRMGVDIYQTQSDPFWDRVLTKGRLRFGRGVAYPRGASVRPVIKHIKEGYAFFNMPDMDFGPRDAIFAPFFGVPAATLMAPSRMAKSLNMLVQPVVVDMLPGGQGYRVRFFPALTNFPTDNPEQDTVWMNQFVEQLVLENPAQYLWVHKRFKTRPEGVGGVY
ncbi:MAG: lysophospholipid acyltransferase family protein [Burkholderiales bacterium]